MMMHEIRNSLYWRIASALMALLLLLGVTYIMMTAYIAKQYYEETSQKLNADVAQHLIHEIKPFKDNGEVDEERLGVLMHSMMAVNPSIEVYLLDQEGQIKSYVVLDKKVKLTSVDLTPVKQFLSRKNGQIVKGENPRTPGEESVFSAAAVYGKEGLQGYVYIILASELYENITDTLLGSYMLKAGSIGFLIALLATMLLGLWILWLLTKNLRKIVGVMQEFKGGNMEVRIEEEYHGEMQVLSSTFNGMADTILESINDLKQVDHLRRELIANVSHDLRTPIAVISGYIETLNMKKGKLTEEQEEKYLNTILKSIEKLKRLVSDLFELSKLEARQIEPRKEPFQLAEVLAETCTKYQVLAKEKQISLQADITEAPMVLADLSMIERVLQNLMENAIRYTPEKGEVEVKIEASKQQEVTVSISNTGEGIAKEKLPHIFDRYYKDSSQAGSTGLGLAIVKNILDIHNAPIWVESTPNQSTQFAFALPAS